LDFILFGITFMVFGVLVILGRKVLVMRHLGDPEPFFRANSNEQRQNVRLGALVLTVGAVALATGVILLAI